MTKQEVITEVKKLNLEPGSYVVYGSAPMAAAGIREAGDIDLYVTPELLVRFAADGWKELVKGPNDKPLVRGDIEAHAHWNFSHYRPTFDHILATATTIDGVAFASLAEVRKWSKLRAGQKILLMWHSLTSTWRNTSR